MRESGWLCFFNIFEKILKRVIYSAHSLDFYETTCDKHVDVTFLGT